MLREDIEGTKRNIKYQVERGKKLFFGVPFSKYQKVYATTNENIEGYITPETVGGKERALTVLASGDQTFNLIQQGVTEIDTFDSNCLTEYYALGLKRAAILKYNYKDFLLFLRKILYEGTSNEELETIIESLLPYMEEKHAKYWQSIIEFNHKTQKESQTDINLFSMLLMNNQIFNLENGYLKSEENYNTVKRRIKKAQINFKCCDCQNLEETFTGNYDSILLSNILDYFYKGKFGPDWNYQQLSEYEESLKGMLNTGGNIFLSYIFLYGSKLSHVYRHNIIEFSSIKRDDLTDEEIITFPPKGDETNGENFVDGMILVKKK